MTVSFAKLRKMIHRKSPEYLAPLPSGNTLAGSFVVADKSDIVPRHDRAFFINGVSSFWNYTADEDGFQQLPISGITGTFGAGSCGDFRAMSAPGGVQSISATGGTTSTITTGLTIVMGLAGVRIRVTEGPGAGYDGAVLVNTVGANATITVTPDSAVAFTAASKFQIFGGSVWFFNAGTVAVGFSVYDFITNAWTARSVTGLPTAWGTDAQIVGTPSAPSNLGAGFVNGTASAGGASTLTDGTKAWPVNGWTNQQVRIKSGTGAGQIRVIASNTSTVLTVSIAWTTAPDATSVYAIEGNDDVLFLFGNNAVTAYRYTISTNTWATLAPVAARAGAFATGGTADWIDASPDWQESSPGVYGAHYAATIIRQNGRYIYSFRGGASNTLDAYDIAANTWVSGIAYGGQFETFTTGSASIDAAGMIYISKEATGRVFQFNVARNRLQPFYVSPMPQGAAVVGDKMFIQSFTEGAETARWLYLLGHTRAEMTRILIV